MLPIHSSKSFPCAFQILSSKAGSCGEQGGHQNGNKWRPFSQTLFQQWSQPPSPVFGGHSEADGRGKAHRKKRLRRCQCADQRPEMSYLESSFAIGWGAYLTIWLVLTQKQGQLGKLAVKDPSELVAAEAVGQGSTVIHGAPSPNITNRNYA